MLKSGVKKDLLERDVFVFFCFFFKKTKKKKNTSLSAAPSRGEKML
jgi:hypothetical protein